MLDLVFRYNIRGTWFAYDEGGGCGTYRYLLGNGRGNTLSYAGYSYGHGDGVPGLLGAPRKKVVDTTQNSEKDVDMNSNKPNTISIDGTDYVRADSFKPVTGTRAVVVVDRGWVFAGDVTDQDGRIYLANAVWLFRWSGGFAAVCDDPTRDGCDIRRIADLSLPRGAEVFRVPVRDGWGL